MIALRLHIKKAGIAALLCLAVLFVSCTKPEAKEQLNVTVTLEEVGCSSAKISVHVDGLSSLDKPFFSVKIKSESILSTGFEFLVLNTNTVREGDMMYVTTNALSPCQNFFYTTRFIHDGVNYDTEMQHFTTEDISQGELIDMGLSVKWASCNLGASKPAELGSLFAWGETAVKDSYTVDNYKWTVPEGYSKYNKTDGLTVLRAEDDPATAILGESWRTPTLEEFNELAENCRWTWMYCFGGAWGLAATSLITGNTIFFPNNVFGLSYANNYYWTSSLYSEAMEPWGIPCMSGNLMPNLSGDAANNINVSYNPSGQSGLPRYEGHAIRPVSNR